MAGNVRSRKNLTVKQKAAIEGLLRGETIFHAAGLAGVSERQLYRWLDEPLFQETLTASGEQAIGAAVRALSDAATTAVVVLRTVAVSETNAAGVRVRAADSILSHVIRLKEIADLEQRVRALERRRGGR